MYGKHHKLLAYKTQLETYYIKMEPAFLLNKPAFECI